MATNSQIEWTEMTWNPVSGCDKVSAGCLNCYAARMAKRLKAMGVERYRNGFEVTIHEDLIEQPFKWRSPRLIFVNSMSDLFHERVPFSFIKQVFRTMNECPQHTFQILTKRPRRVLKYADKLTWTPNIWMGTSVEDQRVIRRIDYLRGVPASVRFLSCEPLIGPIAEMNLKGIHWVIVGGESGPGARPMKEEWVQDILRQCKRLDVAFFFKQWGGVQKKRTGRSLNETTYDEMPKDVLYSPNSY